MTTTYPSNASDFIKLTRWATLAANVTPDTPPDMSLLIDALAGSKFFRSARIAQAANGGHRVEFEIDPPKGFTVTAPRTFNPADAASARVMELAGARLFTVRPSGGNNRLEFHISLGKGRGRRTTLHRILWGIAKGPRLVEGKLINYHDYVPGNFVAQSGLDRAKVIKIIAEHDPALAALLRDLFDIADRWHAHELHHVD